MAPNWTPTTFEEALEALRQRVAITREQFNLLYEAARKKAFTVAAIESVELIEIIQDAIEESIEDGISSAEWKKKVGEVVDRAGWKMTGTQKTARLENVFRTNVMAAYGQGRFEQQNEVADVYPYAKYHAIGDDRTRPEHQELDGKVAPLGSAFWQRHYPPWGYQCLPGDVSVEGAFNLGTRQLYEGKVRKINLRSGRELSLTINHPVLTSRGMVPAGEVEKG